MQEQNFENKVQQKLHGLLLDPSPPVWEEVERALAKKKRERRFFFFLVLLIPVCTGAALYLARSFDPAPAAKGDVPGIVNGTVHPTKKATLPIPAGNNGTPQSSSYGASDVPAQKKALGSEPARAKQVTRSNAHVFTIKPDVLSQGQYKAPLVQPIAGEPDEKPVTTGIAAPAQVVAGTDLLSFVRAKVDSIEAPEKEPSGQRNRSPFSPSFDQLSHGGSPTVQRKWQWSLHAAVGRSAVRSSLFQDGGSVRADYQTGSVAGVPPASRTPSAVHHGGVYTIGVDVRKPLTRKLSLGTGLHYRLAQTRVPVGATVARDTSLVSNNNSLFDVSSYYSTGAAQVLTNRYHFLELPVAVEWQPLQRVPLRLQTSITGARMIAADAVLFGRQSRVYYRQSNAYHKTQLYVGTAIDYRLIQTKGFALRAGPYLHYGMTTLEKRGFVDQHLFDAGFKTNISF